MKASICACALCALLSLPAVAQRGGGYHGGGGVVQMGVPPGATGIPPLGGIPAMGTVGPLRGMRGYRNGFGGGYGYGYGWLPEMEDYTGYGYGYDGQGNQPYAAAPSLVVVPEQLPPPPPPRLVKGTVHDYTAVNPPETNAPAAQFDIVGKDRATHQAVAVWAQSGVLHYVDADGVINQMPVTAVDRAATREANAAKGLRLQVPAE